jgi:endoplasmic reticulum lectin 1
MELVEDVNAKQIEDILGKIDKSTEEKSSHRSFSSSLDDTTMVESFLAGKTCLTGGSGYWKYEFCYGKYVKQYHVDKYGSKTTIVLGLFDEKNHKDFLVANAEKRPKKPLSQRKQIIHFYSGGSVCDKTGKTRQVEVHLKCLQNAQSASAVSLYLLEPKVCNYVLGVESPLICSVLEKVDEDGLVPSSVSDDASMTFEEIIVVDENNVNLHND